MIITHIIILSKGESFAYAHVSSMSRNGRETKMKGANKFRTYQIAVMGPAGVGKSCITNKFIRGVFITEYNNTLEDN